MQKLYLDIIELLKEDARLSPSKIAVMTGANEGEVVNAVKKLEEDGIIVGYAAIIDEEKLDNGRVQALIEVKVAPQKTRGFDAVADEILSLDEVKSLYLMSGGYDLAVFVEGRSLREVATFVSERLSTLDTVLSTATHFILKKYKIEGAVTKREQEQKRLAIHP